MLRLKSNITIGDLNFTYVTNVQINTSWETITDTALIELPNKLRLKNEEIINKINVNDSVTIQLGYHPNLTTRFTGYVSRIVPESPMKIYCEDESFLLKQTSIRSYSKKNLSLETLITDNYSGDVNISDANVGAFRINGATLIEVLQEVRDKYGLYLWFRNGVLYSGLPFTGQDQVEKKFKFQRNIIDGSNLQYTKDFELDTISHGISVQRDGSKIELYSKYDVNGNIVTTATNPGGNLNTIKIPYQTTSQLTTLIERRLPNLYYTGYRGSFLTFGEPVMKHGDITEIIDKKFPERDGKYLIKSIQVIFGIQGSRQIIELDRIIN